MNPSEVLKRLDDIKKDYAAVVKEAQEIQQAQQVGRLSYLERVWFTDKLPFWTSA